MGYTKRREGKKQNEGARREDERKRGRGEERTRGRDEKRKREEKKSGAEWTGVAKRRDDRRGEGFKNPRQENGKGGK